MTYVKMSTVLSIMTALFVVFLAGSAFVLSYDALRALASANGFANWRQYLWPLTLDAFVLVAALSVIRCNLAREGAWFPWLLVIVFTVASVVFNIVHAPSDILAQSIASLPPLVVFLGLELLSSQLRAFVKRADRVYKAQHRELTEDVIEAPAPDIVLSGSDTRHDTTGQAVNTLLAFYADNPGATQVQAGIAVSRSRQWVSGKLAELEKQGIITRNNGEGTIVSALRGD